MSKPLVILLLLCSTSVVTFTAGQTPGPFSITTRPFSITTRPFPTITPPRPFSITTRPFSITTRPFPTITTPRPFSITTRPFPTITPPRPFSITTRPFSITTRPFSITTRPFPTITPPCPFSITTRPFPTITITTPRPFSITTRPFPTTTITTPRPFPTTTITTPRPFPTTTITTPRPFPTTTITTPRPFPTTTITTPRPFPTTTITTPRPFPTTTITTPRPFPTTTITTPRPFPTTTITTPRPFPTTTITTPRPFPTTTITTPRPFPTTTITTPRASTQTCKADEEWQLRNNRSGCFCKDPYNVTALSQVVPEKTYGSFEMTAIFHKCQFNDLSIYFNKSHVKDTACYDFQDDPVTNTFTILVPLKVGSCGVQKTNDTHVTYIAVITIDVDTFGTTPGRKTLTATLQYSYKLDMIASLNTVPDPIFSTIFITVAGKGQFKVYMALYKDSNYKTPYSGSEVALSTDQFLYVGVFFPGGTSSDLVLVMKNCYATPGNDANDSTKYYFIQNSCLNKADGSVTVPENGVSRQGRFSVPMFKFVGNYDRVYLHCAVSLCDSTTENCRPVCSRAGSPSDGIGFPKGYDSSDPINIGPIRRSESASSTINSAHIFWTLLIPALTILIQSL
ncbi:pancreatic secretory granule membrane major glycoprotein GP2-like isoform X10 [Lithobates pipiens]